MTHALSDMIMDYIEYLEVEGGRSTRTAENYRLYLERVVEFMGDIDVEAITPEMIRKYRLWLNRHVNESGQGALAHDANYHLIALRDSITYHTATFHQLAQKNHLTKGSAQTSHLFALR